MEHHRQHDLDELLELLHHLHEKHQIDLRSLHEHQPEISEESLHRLKEHGLITFTPDRLELTEEGLRRAEQIIRRHRLAERLLTDVLHMSLSDAELGACEFEHVVAEEIADSICTLLGHPETCPHGSPIPRGACCLNAAKQVTSAIVPLTDVPLGVWARVAHVSSFGDERQHQLTHFGIVPGARVRVHQRKPAYVVALEGRRLAMEESVARSISVWRKWEEEPARAPSPRRFRLFGRRSGGAGA